MKPAKERLVLSTLTPEQLKAITPKQFGESQEYFDWKNGVRDEDGNVIQEGIVRRRLELLDKLLSTGEWISSTRMMEEINAFYLDAPNDECYWKDKPPHRLIESKEGGRKQFESALSLMFAGTIRQDRFTLNNILRMVGKEHIFEKIDGEGIEGRYRYKTKYSIFEKYTINDIEFDDYELANRIPLVLESMQTDFKIGDNDSYLEEVADNIENLDLATIKSINLLSSLAKALKQARVINNNLIATRLEEAFKTYDEHKEGWEKIILKNTNNAYSAAAHPDADIDKGLLFYIRMLIIITKIVDGAEPDILGLLKKEAENMKLPEIASAYPEVEEFVNAAFKYYVFEFSDYEGMANELEKHLQSCVDAGGVVEDYGLMIAIHAFIYPEEWQYDERMYECLVKLIDIYKKAKGTNDYTNWMLLLFICLKQYMEAAQNGSPASSFSEWSRLKFELISYIEPDIIGKMVYDNAPDDDLHAMLHIGDLEDQGRFAEYMILTDMRFDMQDVYKSLLAKDGRYLEYISTEEAVQIYEELLKRFETLGDVFAEAEYSSLLSCRLSLALLHDALSHENEALEYYTSVKNMYNKGDVELTDKLSRFVNERIESITGRY